MHCPISLSAHHIQGADLSISSWVPCSQHWSTLGYTKSFFWSQHFKLLLEEKAEQMVPGLGATHLWRLLKAQPGQRPLAVLNNLSTYSPFLLLLWLLLHQPYERGSALSAVALELKMPKVRNWLCYILVDRCRNSYRLSLAALPVLATK